MAPLATVPPNHPENGLKSASKTPDISVAAGSASGVPDIMWFGARVLLDRSVFHERLTHGFHPDDQFPRHGPRRP
jgi:hypothetical protein